jgi:uncharacterized protein (TIGR03437 family)
LDATTKGNWKNVYGSQGYNTINDAMSYPSYAQIAVTGYTSPTWMDSTTDIRALQKAIGTDRVAARWSSNSSFTIDLNITDGQAHRVAFYNLDWDGNNRSQRVDITDWVTNITLDTKSISSFNGGQYLVWDIRGRVKITVTRTGAKTAVLSGLFFGAAPNPTPTPTPSPSPTPTPTPGGNNPPAVALTAPSVNSVFGTGSNITIQSSANDSDGSIAKVDIYKNGILLGTATSSPYNYIWNNIPNGNYSLTAIATDNLGATTTSSPVAISVKNSPASVDRARGRGNTLLNDLSTYPGYGGGDGSYATSALTSDLQLLSSDVFLAYADFVDEQNAFAANSQRITANLLAALYFTRADAALAARVGGSTSVRNHLLRIVAHLAICEDLLLYGNISTATLNQAIAAQARLDVAIGPAIGSYSTVSPTALAPLSLGSVFGHSVFSPLSPQTLFAPIRSDGTVPYELAGVSVTVGGKSVPVVYVSPSRVSFYVGPDVPLGTVEIIVTAQNGFVSCGLTTIVPNATQLITAKEDGSGGAIALNYPRPGGAAFELINQDNFGADKRTRLLLSATGISGSALNSNPANDIAIGNLVRPNFAESVIVQARLSDGSLINLPVEFAGAQGVLPGLDQVNVVLTSQLSGAGTVELTLIVGGQRSNSTTIVVQ